MSAQPPPNDTSERPPVTPVRRWGRPLLIWAAASALGAALLAGRFDWQEAGGRFARPAYLCSLFFLLITPAVAHQLARALGSRPAVARAIAGALLLIECLPYHWLGLQRFRLTTTIYPPPPDTRMEWFPAALARGGFPHEVPFFLALAVIAALLVWLAGGGPRRPRASWPAWLSPVIAAFVLILLQTWLHTSLRSPYTYTQYFEEGTWHHRCLLPGGFAAVNGDVGFFTTLNDLFNGLPRPVQTMLLRRSFLHYLSSPFTYFWNPFHVYLVLNTVLWLVAVLCTYGWARRAIGDARVAMFAAALVCIGNGFVYFAAQPMHYLAGYAAVAVLLFLFELLMVDQRRPVLFGVLLGLCAATYDLFPFYPGLLIYGLVRHAPWKRTLVALAISLAVYGGFILVAYRIAGLPNNAYNTDHGTRALAQILATLRHPRPGELYWQSVNLVRVYAQNLAFAFFLVESAIAVAALLWMSPERRRLVLAVMAPAAILNVYLFFGQVPWAGTLLIELPRFTYIAYPAVYLAVALVLARLRPRWAWAALGLLFVWHNVDVFGLPDMHFHFYFPQKLFFLRPGSG